MRLKEHFALFLWAVAPLACIAGCERDWGFIDGGQDGDAGAADGGAPTTANDAAADSARADGDADASAAPDAPGEAASLADGSGVDAASPWTTAQRVDDGAPLFSNGPPGMASTASESIVLSVDPASEHIVEDTYVPGSFTRKTITPIQSQYTPGVAVHGDSFVLVHLVGDDNNNGPYPIRWATRPALGAWGADTPITFAGDGGVDTPMLAGDVPAIASFNGAIVIVFRVGSSLHYSRWDGNHWAPDVALPASSAWGRPALAVYNQTLYLASHRYTDTTSIEIRTFDGSTWSTGTVLANATTPYDVSLTVHRNRLFLMHLIDSSYRIGWLTFDGASWSADTLIPTQQSWWAPHIADMNGQLLMLRTTKTDFTEIWYSTYTDP